MDRNAATLNLDYRPPLDWSFFLGYLGARLTAGVEAVDGERYSHAIEIDGHTGSISITHHPHAAQLVVTIRGDVRRHERTICKRVRRMFDLDLDPSMIHSVLGEDPWIGPLLAARPGIRIPGAWSAFELLVRAIVSQQVSVKAASTIMGRIASRLGTSVAFPRGAAPTLLFPSPSKLADGNLDAIGMPARRIETLRNVARMIADKTIPFPDRDGNANEVKEALLSQSGIGQWTVEYFALRALRDTDAWPETDLVLRRWIEKHTQTRTNGVFSVPDGWRPYRAYAAMHLWNRAPTATPV